MANFEYPATDYDTPANLLAVLGSWWADKYSGRDQVAAVVDARASIETQAVFDLLELISAMSRFTVPVYHTRYWYPLYLRASQRNTPASQLHRYDDGLAYDAGGQYDVPVTTLLHAFPCPTDLVNAPVIMNRFVAPTLTQLSGVDYRLVDGQIVFQRNPFDDIHVAKRAVYTDGIVTDTEAVLWVYRGEFDWETTYKQFGYAVGMQMQSSKGYNSLLNAVYDAIVGGTTTADVINALSAMTGVPLVRETVETVIDIVEDNTRLLIITDLHVYQFKLTANPVVAIGDTVQQGQPLTDAFRVYELNHGTTPQDLYSLAIGPGFLATCFYADLVFENKDVPLQVDTNHPSGYTMVSWGLGGFPLDVAHFFEEMHARGVQAAQQPVDTCNTADTIRYPENGCDATDVLGRRGTLAHLLDIRTVRTGEPGPQQLPTTINPLRFLIENVLRNNTIVVRISVTALGVAGVGLQHTRLLRKITPPDAALIILLDLTAEPETVTVDVLTESINLFDGMAILSDTVTTVSDTGPSIQLVGGTCQ